MKIPCPHFNIQIVSRGKGRSVVAAAAYQSGQTLYSQYTGKWEPGEHEGRIVHTEILLPPNAPREYADRQTLWNAVDASEKGQDAQTARRFIIALPKELTIEQNIELIRNYCQTTFVDKGMIADIAVHFNDEDPPNPHAHILLTMRSMDEHGKWQAKSKNMYALDENGNRIIGKNGKPKRIKVNTVDWNDPGNCERWRHEWEVQQNMALEEAGRSERIDMRSYERQGVEVIPETHLGPAASALEKQGIRTRMGDHNNAVRMINSLFKAVKRKVKEFGNWLKGLTETISDHKKIENPYDYPIMDVLMAYVDMRRKEREGWNHGAQSKYGIRDLSELMITCNYLRDHGKEIIRSAKQLAKKECANWYDDICLMTDRPCRVINPAYSSVHDGCIDCDWFVQAVLPLEPELQKAYWHEIFREECDAGEGWKECLRCHKLFVPGSNRQQYCSECGSSVSRASNRERQRRFRENRKATPNVTV